MSKNQKQLLPSPFPMSDKELELRMKSAKPLTMEQFEKRLAKIKEDKTLDK